MKTQLLYCFLLTLGFSNVFSQTLTDTSHQHEIGVINIYPLQIIPGELRLGFEKPLKDNQSLEIGLGYLFWGEGTDNWAPDDNVYGVFIPFKINYGFTARAGIRFYSMAKRDYGLYVSPSIFLKYLYYHDSYETDNEYAIGGQFLVGYKYPSKSKISFDIYVGLGAKYEYYPIGDGLAMSFFYPCLPLGITIGYLLNKK